MKHPNSIIGQFEGKCADSVENNNAMLLSDELWKHLFESEQFKHFIKLRHYIGFLGHPEDPACQDFKNACIVMTEGHIDSDGQVYGKFDLLDTPVGRIVKALIDGGVQFGISVRGAGDVGLDGYVNPDTFIFRGFDLVAFPAYNDAIPKFTPLAASRNDASRKKYMNVCNAISDNINSITSSQSLDIIKSQFNPKSNQYAMLEFRQKELEGESADESVDDPDMTHILDSKVTAMTNLYLEELNQKHILESKLVECENTIHRLESRCKRLQRVMSASNRIMNSQLASISARNSDLYDSYQNILASNNILNEKLHKVESQNLKYRQRANSSDCAIKQKDEVIASLRSKLSKTFEKTKRSDKRASDLDGKIASLESDLEQSEKLIADYQDAYANMYAHALGSKLDSISVTASTSVDELKSIIHQQSFKNTSDLDGNENMMDDDLHEIEVIDSIDDSGIVTL